MIKNFIRKGMDFPFFRPGWGWRKSCLSWGLLFLVAFAPLAAIAQNQSKPDVSKTSSVEKLTAVDKKGKSGKVITQKSTMSSPQSRGMQNRKVQSKLTNTAVLNKLSMDLSQEYDQNKAKALVMAKEKNWLVQQEVEGRIMELQGVDQNKQPLYYITHNAGAAKTTSTDKVYANGGMGLALDGSGIHAGIWDGGGVRVSHQEFNNTGGGRVTQMDNPSSTNYHATHVAGTMVAGGLDANAKGMAFNGTLNAYDWNNDNAEMAAEAAEGLLISNHSYGYVHGWYWTGITWSWAGDPSISTEEDYRFGFYSEETKVLDEIAHNAPYYLIVKSAGNDRGDGPTNGTYPQDGPYDCVGTTGVAKNILTVGAVNQLSNGYQGNPSDVVMSSFSSWGPVDDGRIKPDIVAKGVNVYSTLDEADDSYTTMSGTSMSSPSTAGSLMLLQEHYYNLNNAYMKSATLKALAIQTADEAGPAPGPDYMYGWGLLNTATAASVISNKDIESIIQEREYTGSTQELTVKASGTEPLVVTIVWTDLPGSPVAPALDPEDIMLVNDLDLKVTGNDEDFYPYKLDKFNPEAAATTGVNDVDNVEKIVIANAVAGETYTVSITHKGDITGGSQAFSLIATGVLLEGSYTASFEVLGTDGPVEGASVNLNGLLQMTDSTGSASFVVQDEESYDYTVNAYGYEEATGAFTVEGDHIAETVTLTPTATYSVTFMVKAEETDLPIENALVEIDQKSGLTDSTGVVVIQGIYEGEQSYKVTANEFIDYSASLTISGDEFVEVLLEATPLLWDNFSTVSTTSGIVSTNLGGLGEIPSGLVESADDFIVPAGAIWNDIDIYAYGFSNSAYPGSYYVAIYADEAGQPGSAVFEDFLTPENSEEPVFPLNNMNLTSGKYWLTIAGHYPTASSLSSARWNMYTVMDTKAEEAQLRDNAKIFGDDDTWAPINGLIGEATTSLKFAIYKGTPRFPATFTVMDQNGVILPEAPIVIEGEKTIVTDENGEATVALAEGTYHYSIEVKGYEALSGEFVMGSEPLAISVELAPLPTYTVTFNITNEEQMPLAGAKLSVDGQVYLSDDNGVAKAELLPDSYTFTVKLSEYDSYTDTITVVDAPLSKQVALIYNGIFFYENFEGEVSEWITIDADGDGQEWFVKDYGDSSKVIDGTSCMTSDSFNSTGALRPDNWLISPEITIPTTGDFRLSYFVAPHSATWEAEHYKCVVSTGGTEISDFPDENILFEETLTVGEIGQYFHKREVDLTDYAGQTIRIAWVHFDTYNEYAIKLDAISVYTPMFDLTFEVIDERRNPVADAQIIIAEDTLFSDAAGLAIKKMPNGTAFFTAEKSGFAGVADSLTVDNADLTIPVMLIHQSLITFEVTDENDVPLAGANVFIAGDSLLTDMVGKAEIELVNGKFDYVVSLEGYDFYAGSLTVFDEPDTEKVTLKESLYEVYFNVKDESEAPLADAMVIVDGKAVTSDAEGMAIVSLTAGAHAYEVVLEGFYKFMGDLTVAENGQVELVNLIQKGHLVTFEVRDNKYQPLADATIEIAGVFLTTDASGKATKVFNNGTYAYTASLEGYDAVAGEVVVRNYDPVVRVTLTAPTYTVKFLVSDENGKALKNAWIKVDGQHANTNGAGKASMELSNGEYDYEVSLYDYPDATGTLSVSGADMTMEVTMAKAIYTVTFEATDQNSVPLAGVNIAIDGETLTTDDAGMATVTKTNGWYNYVASLEGFRTKWGMAVVQNKDVKISFSLKAGGFMATFVVLTEEGELLENAMVKIDGEDIFTDENGEAAIELEEGEYDYQAIKDGYKVVDHDVIAIHGENISTNVYLRQSAILGVEESKFLIYPNPVHNVLNISGLAEGVISKAVIYTEAGKLVSEMEFATQSEPVQLNVAHLAKGLYIIQIYSEDKEVIRSKFIK
ncbi:S8 family serine peptidase [Persicobacter sp. CCB-QB2]|uniref:S8 family serine peptidase n=1 Tax=Persicobacter sp. CCB-QB2 TaxID=1561025 RepID=UPI0006A9AA93|nr:S8 family serine peptidase [Persicobacter sp. CCB-QB2]